MTFAGFMINLAILSTFLMLYVYKACHKEVTWFQRVFVFYLSITTLLPICLLPLEMSDEPTIQSFPDEIGSDLSQLWLGYYWVNFFNGYLILPISIGYYLSGYFSKKQRIIDAFLTNIIFYIVTIMFGLFFYLILTIRYGIQMDQLKESLPKFFNTACYLFFSVLLGLGMFKLPMRFLKVDFYIKIHEYLIVFEETTHDYHELVSNLIHMEEVM